MNAVILFEDAAYRNFMPLVYWRPVFRLRCGRAPLMERARSRLGGEEVGLWVRPDLREVTAVRYSLPVNTPADPGTVLVNARWTPEGRPEIGTAPCLGMLDDQIAYVCCDETLAGKLSTEVMLDDDRLHEAIETVPRVDAKGRMFNYPWDLIIQNGDMLLTDWQAEDGSICGQVHPGAHILNSKHVHIGEATVVKPGAVIDASEGPIYIGDHVTIMPNAIIEGPTFIGHHSVINAGAWIRTKVSIGPGCKVGGEVGISIIHALSNKQHHGFLGHSYIAEWVNIGAGTTTSNLKNTYGEITVPVNGRPVKTGQTFVGSIIGDFAKTGINQTLTTGSVIGFGSSIATSSINPQFVPSFCFITDQKNEPYDIARCLEVARRTMTRRNTEMSSEERTYFQQLPAIAADAESI